MFRFLRELAGYSLEVKDREIKHSLTSLFVEILIPVAAVSIFVQIDNEYQSTVLLMLLLLVQIQCRGGLGCQASRIQGPRI